MTSCLARWTPPLPRLFFSVHSEIAVLVPLSAVWGQVCAWRVVSIMYVYGREQTNSPPHPISTSPVQQLLFCRRIVLEDAMSSNPRPI